MKKNKFGFTLIEILVSLSLLGILALITIPSYQLFISDKNIEASASNVSWIIRNAQTKSYNGFQNESYGVFFDSSSTPNRFILFKGTTYDPIDSDNEIHELPSIIKFENINLEGKSEITFNEYKFEPNTTGSVTLQNNRGEESTIYISKYGSIYSD